MKIKLWCRLFGHDWREWFMPFEPSDYCSKCGLSKKEAKEKELNSNE